MVGECIYSSAFAEDGPKTGYTPVLAKGPKKRKNDVTPSKWPASRRRVEARDQMCACVYDMFCILGGLQKEEHPHSPGPLLKYAMNRLS